MKQLKCEMCGSTELIKQEGVFVCQSCGCKYSVEEAKKMMIEGTVKVQGTVLVDKAGDTEAWIKRAFMLLEDGDWNAANQYCEKVLDVDPENAQAYLGKLMVDLRVNKQEDIVNSYLAKDGNFYCDFTQNNNYKKAILFGDCHFKATLENLADQFHKNKDLFLEQLKPFKYERRGDNEIWINGLKDTSIQNIEIPNAIRRINDYAFRDCNNLLEAKISNSVHIIRYGAFVNCWNLTTVKLPDGFDNFQPSVFFGCHSLKNIDLSNALYIHPSAFYRCSSLTDIVFTERLYAIEESAFAYCTSLKNIIIPDSTISLGKRAFAGCSSLTSVTIGKGITKIPEGVFEDCSNLTTITFNGTIFEWSKVVLVKTWNRKVPAKHIICTDGVVKIRKSQC